MYRGKFVLAINYADEPWREAQKYNTLTAYKNGHADKVIEYGPDSIDNDFRSKHKNAFVMNDPKIGRWGLWRPHILWDAFSKINQGDYLIYCDSGAYYLKSISLLLDAMEAENTDLMVFDLYHPERKFCKRDIFIAMNCDNRKFVDSTLSIPASVSLLSGN